MCKCHAASKRKRVQHSAVPISSASCLLNDHVRKLQSLPFKHLLLILYIKGKQTPINRGVDPKALEVISSFLVDFMVFRIRPWELYNDIRKNKNKKKKA